MEVADICNGSAVSQLSEVGAKDGAATHSAPLRAPLELVPFTGKEKDSETGYYAFGARYYDCDLSGIFLSVDPMSDKYPEISPYHYCHWNPVLKRDFDGRDDDNYIIYETGQIYKEETSDNTNTYTYIRNDLSEVDLGTYDVCSNNYGEDVISIGEENSGRNSMFSWMGITSGNLFFEEDAFAALLGGIQFFYDNFASSEIKPVRINQMMSPNRVHSSKGNRHSAIDIAYYSASGIPGAHVDRPKDNTSVTINLYLANSLKKFGLGSDNIFTSVDAKGSSAFLEHTNSYPGHNTHMHFQGFNNVIYQFPKISVKND